MKLSKLVIAIFAMSAAGAMAHGNKQKTTQTSADQPTQATASADTSSSSLMQGNNISQAQQALNDQGFDAGPVDGKFGPQTQAAVKKFQASKSLTQTGKLDQPTLAALNTGSGNIASASTGDGANNAASPSSGTTASTTSSTAPSAPSAPSGSSSMGASGSSSMGDTTASDNSAATSQQSSSTTK